MEKTITCTVNGQTRTVITDPERPLLEGLREELDRSRAKYGCGKSECDACGG